MLTLLRWRKMPRILSSNRTLMLQSRSFLAFLLGLVIRLVIWVSKKSRSGSLERIKWLGAYAGHDLCFIIAAKVISLMEGKLSGNVIVEAPRTLGCNCVTMYIRWFALGPISTASCWELLIDATDTLPDYAIRHRGTPRVQLRIRFLNDFHEKRSSLIAIVGCLSHTKATSLFTAL
mmetsp:Transcript_26864/g.79402  ORF Transcript_26864/g.79402 Transcript_26864/m.79402 type:complete len:176 (-) Transcript_26864:55-582(-)